MRDSETCVSKEHTNKVFIPYKYFYWISNLCLLILFFKKYFYWISNLCLLILFFKKQIFRILKMFYFLRCHKIFIFFLIWAV